MPGRRPRGRRLEGCRLFHRSRHGRHPRRQRRESRPRDVAARRDRRDRGRRHPLGEMTVRKAMWVAVAALSATGAFSREKPKPVVIESAVQSVSAPPADQAQIVFVEPINKIQGLFPVAIYELDGDNRTLLAVSWWKGKTVALLPPGKHMLFATPGGLGHVMEANVEAGKRYYVLLRFIYANGFQMRPLRTSGNSDYRTTSPDFAKWIKETRWVE